MGSIVNYVLIEQDSFRERPFCAVDSLILAEMAYRCFDGLVACPPQGLEGLTFAQLLEEDLQEQLLQSCMRNAQPRRQLLRHLKRSGRFGRVRLTCFVKKTEEDLGKQFAALTYVLDDGTVYVAYRGTDHTLVGVKEDFLLACSGPIPSQREALAYLNEIARRTEGKLRLGGHSKGGNLAIYAAMHCADEVRARITDVYCHDGPGFLPEVMQSEEYERICDRIRCTIPKSSLVGVLLQQKCACAVVDSEGFWFMQHDPFNWLVEGRDFRYTKRLKAGARYMDSTLNGWLEKYDDEKRTLFIEAMFEILQATNVRSITELTVDWRPKAYAALSAIKGLDPPTRRFVRKGISALILLAIKNIPHLPRLRRKKRRRPVSPP